LSRFVPVPQLVARSRSWLWVDRQWQLWAMAARAGLLLYEIPIDWDDNPRAHLIGSLRCGATSRRPGAPSVGWLCFEMTPTATRVIRRGSLRETRAWCRVLEICRSSASSTKFELHPDEVGRTESRHTNHESRAPVASRASATRSCRLKLASGMLAVGMHGRRRNGSFPARQLLGQRASCGMGL